MSKKNVTEQDRIRKIVKTEQAKERANVLGANLIGWTDEPVGEILPTSADKPITVNGVVVGSKKPTQTGPKLTLEKAKKTFGKVVRTNI